MVRIRMQRIGRPHLPMYRINAVDKRVKRDGKVLENLGWYHPTEKDASKRVLLEVERIKHWLATGAQPSDTVMDLLVQANILDGAEWKATRESRAKASAERQAKIAAAAPADKKKK